MSSSSRKARFAAVAVCLLVAGLLQGPAEAQSRGGDSRGAQPREGAGRPAPSGRPVVARGSYVFIGGYFYDPFYGPYPWWPRSAYQWGYYPYYAYRAEVRIQATPRDAAVYVDGFYAGIVDDFDGTFQRLPLSPGGHRIELYLEGFRTVQRNLYLQTGTTMKLHETMERLGPGETSVVPRRSPSVPEPPEGSFTRPRGRAPRELPPPPEPVNRPDSEGFGTLVLRVQPPDAEVSIDGQRWLTSGPGQFEVQVPVGRHRVEVVLQGFERYAADIEVREGEPTPLNISLARGR